MPDAKWKIDPKGRKLLALEPAPGGAQRDYFDPHYPGLSFRVGASLRVWTLHTRVLRGGEWRLTRIPVGRHPPMMLDEARRKAEELRTLCKSGKDPIAMRAGEVLAQKIAAEGTFSKACDDYLANLKADGRSEAYAAEVDRAVERDFADWRDRPAASIGLAEIRHRLKLISRRGRVQANRTKSYLSAIFNRAASEGLIAISPMAAMRKRLHRERPRDRVLAITEIPIFWQAVEADPQWANALKLMLLTGRRPGEVLSIERKHLHLDAEEGAHFVIPAAKDDKRRYLVPLSPQALRVVRDQIEAIPDKQERLFCTMTGRPLGPDQGTFMKAKVDPRLAELAGAPFPTWRPHDLRRTVETHLARLKVSPEIRNAIAGHAQSGMQKVYNQWDYFPEKKEALDKWSAEVEKLLAPKSKRRPELAIVRG